MLGVGVMGHTERLNQHAERIGDRCSRQNICTISAKPCAGKSARTVCGVLKCLMPIKARHGFARLLAMEHVDTSMKEPSCNTK